MSEFLQRLRRQAKELNALERDLRVHPKESMDWQRTTMSSAVVGLGTPVERSFLADYFLTTWAEWRGLYQRYPRYFGHAQESLPHPWHRTAHQCRRLAGRLFRDPSLGEALAASWAGQDEESEPPQGRTVDDADAAVLYRGLVPNHLRLSALAAGETDLVPKNGAWIHCADLARRADGRWADAFADAPAGIRGAVLWHVRHYRHASLAVSWLNGGPSSTLDRLLREDTTTTFDMEGWLAALHPRSETAHNVRRVVLRVCQAIAEIGYESFVEDVTSKEFAAGDDSPLGSAQVTLIPGGRPDRLSCIVVGVTKGKWGRALGVPPCDGADQGDSDRRQRANPVLVGSLRHVGRGGIPFAASGGLAEDSPAPILGVGRGRVG